MKNISKILVILIAFAPFAGTKCDVLAIGSEGGTIQLLDMNKGKLKLLRDGGSSIECLAFDQSGKTLASGFRNGKIELWNINTGEKIRDLAGHRGEVSFVVFSPDNKTLASGSLGDKIIKIWDINTGEKIKTVKDKSSVFDRDLHWITSVAISSDSKTAAFGLPLNTKIELIETDTNELSASLENDSIAQVLVFSPDGKALASSGSGKIKLWDIGMSEFTPSGDIGKAKDLGEHRQVTSIAFSPDGTTLASLSLNGEIKLWDIKARKMLKHLKNAKSASISFSPDSKKLIFGSDKAINVWDIKAEKQLKGFRDKQLPHQINAIVFQPPPTKPYKKLEEIRKRKDPKKSLVDVEIITEK